MTLGGDSLSPPIPKCFWYGTREGRQTPTSALSVQPPNLRRCRHLRRSLARVGPLEGSKPLAEASRGSSGGAASDGKDGHHENIRRSRSPSGSLEIVFSVMRPRRRRHLVRRRRKPRVLILLRCRIPFPRATRRLLNFRQFLCRLLRINLRFNRRCLRIARRSRRASGDISLIF